MALYLALAAASAAIGCDSAANASNTTKNGFVTVAPDVRLHYLDFGGKGEYLLFLAGSGNSAHIFDGFADRFTDSFHVVALTRRGFGESSQPPDGYDAKTLSEDIQRAMDSLHIDRAAIVGHSLAGTEMTRFAADHPQRMTKLAYLDAAYDWASPTEGAPVMPPKTPQPTTEQLASAAGFTSYVGLLNGVSNYPEADILATNVFDKSGKYQRSKTPPNVATAFATSATKEHPPYDQLSVPVLAIYTVPDSVTDMFPWVTQDSPEWKAANEVFPAAKASLAERRASFPTHEPDATIVEMRHVPHFLFLAKPDDVEKTLRSFLLAT